MYIFSVDYNIIDNSNIVIIDKYLNEETRYKIMIGFIKKGLLDY